MLTINTPLVTEFFVPETLYSGIPVIVCMNKQIESAYLSAIGTASTMMPIQQACHIQVSQHWFRCMILMFETSPIPVKWALFEMSLPGPLVFIR
jgi:hypothetical protein